MFSAVFLLYRRYSHVASDGRGLCGQATEASTVNRPGVDVRGQPLFLPSGLLFRCLGAGCALSLGGLRCCFGFLCGLL